jgi:hypothetical protein
MNLHRVIIPILIFFFLGDSSPLKAQGISTSTNIDKLIKTAYCISVADNKIFATADLLKNLTPCGVGECSKETEQSTNEFIATLKSTLPSEKETRRRMALYVTTYAINLPNNYVKLIAHSKKLGEIDVKTCSTLARTQCHKFMDPLFQEAEYHQCQDGIPECLKIHSCDNLQLPF